ncbi:MAG: putative molybdenum carrier protein [Pseudomonadota bacterium]
MNPIPLRIVCGGQTGADRGAMMAAFDRGVPLAGWCPSGRKAEDGTIPSFYPVRELADSDYPERTLRNVLDSDATCIVRFSDVDAGSKLAAAACRREDKPYLYLDAHELDSDDAAGVLEGFIREHAVAVLNVSGPRASTHPAAESWTRAALRRCLAALQSGRPIRR